MGQVLVCLTANHSSTEFELLDRVSRSITTTAVDIVGDRGTVRGAVVLSTCNRFEAYLDVAPGRAEAAVAAVFAALSADVGPDAAELRRTTAVLVDGQVVEHLFAVSSGLESMVVGEDEISGQVQRALLTARGEHTSSPDLERLFQRAGHASRSVRSATDLGAAGRSVVRLALDLAATRISDWAAARILVIGTGRYAATTIAALRARGAGDIRVYSATGRADLFAAKYAVTATSDIGAAIADADVVITCTARYTVTAAQVPAGAARLIIDLGLPRNVDPAVASVAGVELLDLEVLALHAPLDELGAGARALVREAADDFTADRIAADAVVALRSHVLQVLDSELARSGGDPATDRALRHLASVLMHAPTARIRELARDGRISDVADALDVLFGLRVESTDGEAVDSNAG